MKPANLSANDSGSRSTGLETRSGTKKKIKPEVAGGVVNSSAGSLPAALLHLGDEKCKVSWRSKVENDESSMSEVSNVENMTNTIAEETSYAEFGKDNEMNEATPKKTQTHTYVLGKSLKAPMFDSISDVTVELFRGSSQITNP
ncbi:hypothetical protein G9A89_021316 [Geosiphon pyriformis]|nr:hypothetical protein G9A89_021316 [Geosiphon pyriformis]